MMNTLVINKDKPRFLWANVYCLLDSSSGASLLVREMLRQLATNFISIRSIRLNPMWSGFMAADRLTISFQLLVSSTGKIVTS